jgi:hemoglobin
MKDIENRTDLELLFKEFYTRLLNDNSINYIFIDIAKIDLETHLPHITDFWEQSLFYTGGYKKNVMQIHLDINDKEKLTEEHFKTWLNHFFESVDDLFKGINAEKIKTRAESIATVMKLKLSGH